MAFGNATAPRDALRSAHGARAAAQSALERAIAAAARGQAHLDEAEAHLRTFEDLDALASRQRVERLKEWARSDRSGGESDAEPMELQVEREGRGRAEARAADARTAHEALEAEVRGALDAAVRAAAAVSDAAVAVIRERAASIAVLLDGAEELRRRLRRRLLGLGSVWVALPGQTAPKPFPMPASAVAALDPREPQHAGAGSDTDADAAMWRERLAALAEDPEARLDDDDGRPS